MKFFVSKKVLDFGLKIRFVRISNIRNIENDVVNNYIKTKSAKLLELYKDFNVETDPILKGFNEIHERALISKRKNVPAGENLIRNLITNNNYKNINPLVDIYNLISIESKLCLGAHDIANVCGDVYLRFHNGDEIYNPLGDMSSSKVKLSEYSYIDSSNEILCRLEVRQVKKTMVKEDTTDVFYIVEGNLNTPDDYLIKYSNLIIEETTKYLGGNGEIIDYSLID